MTTCYTPKEAASILKFGQTKIYQMCKSGKLKAKKIGRDWRITQQAIDECLNGKSKTVEAY